MKIISSFIIAVFIFSTAVIVEEFIYLIVIIMATILLYFNILKGELGI